MITTKQLLEWREKFRFSAEQWARYLGWDVGTLLSYEAGVPILPVHYKQLASIMGIESDYTDTTKYTRLERRFSSNGAAYLDDQELFEEYSKIGGNPAYDMLTRGACASRSSQIQREFKRRPRSQWEGV